MPLARGYLLVRTSPGELVIVAPNRHTVVVTYIRAYRVDGDIVSGELQASAAEGRAFFLLDTRTNAVTSPMAEAEWLMQRKALGLDGHALKPPPAAGFLWPRWTKQGDGRRASGP